MDEEKFLTSWNLYAFVNYKCCYRDLLYLGYESSLEETFTRRKSKKAYNDFQKLRDNKVFSVLMVDTPNYHGYIEPLFHDAQKI